MQLGKRSLKKEFFYSQKMINFKPRLLYNHTFSAQVSIVVSRVLPFLWNDKGTRSAGAEFIDL